jgi:hypothetical protein
MTNQSESEHPPILAQTVRISQIIRFALIAGPASFAAYLLVNLPKAQDDSHFTSWLMAGFAVVVVMLRLVVPLLVTGKLRSAIASGKSVHQHLPVDRFGTDENKLCAVYQTQMLIGAALLEGAAFANLAAYMIEAQIMSLAIAVGLLIGMLVDFPTLASVGAWIKRQQRLLDEERMLAGPAR